jgi:signal peptidase I
VQTDAEKNVTQGVSSWWGRALVGRRPEWTLARVVVLIVVTFVLFKFLFIPIQVVGTSMAPTYRDGSYKLVNRLAYRKRPPKRGDVVAISLPGTRVLEVKRIIGLPGERISVRSPDGVVMINGEPLEEPYLKRKGPWARVDDRQLRENEYYVVGDNRRISEHDAVQMERIVGKVVF